ncbi:MAG: FHA domain-containing protein [Kiritimatiellaeota bacterium]|nr:FHA domain-containing protein [Kiritimatiellota bacterium]
MPTFTVQSGYDKSKEIEIKEGVMMIGRETDCAIVLSTANASRHHLKVTNKDGKVVVEDLGSSNGTFVNSTPIAEPYQLKHQDVIQIGENIFVFHDTEKPSEPTFAGPIDGQSTSEYYTFSFMGIVIKKLEANLKKVIKGKPDAIRDIITALFADGHILVEDMPGVGKSVLAQALAKSIQGIYKRIQFTPDMLPSDITGLSVYDQKTKEFSFKPGPIFGNIILADEINRTTPRTQASLLECMSESSITIDGTAHVLPKPFFVIATQNPSDYHGTYPLPEPQLDRFLMRISIGYPSPEVEKEILNSQLKHHPLNDISYVVKAMDIMQCQALVRQVHISDEVKDYIVRIVAATRSHQALAAGCSPRASLALMRLSQSLATYYERDYVIPRDVRELAPAALGHRAQLKAGFRGKWANAGDVIAEILETVPVKGE